MRKLLFVLLMLLQIQIFCEERKPLIHQKECILPVKLLFSIGAEGEKDEMLFRPIDFAVAENGNIYVLDSGDCLIKCFSEEGKFLFSFGKEGEGPGEFSKEASTLKVLRDGNLYLIDNLLRRITVFSQKGEYLKSFKTKAHYSDIFLFKDRYFLTDFELERKHKPIHMTKNLNKIEKSFGEIIDPNNIFKSKEYLIIKEEISLEEINSIVVNSMGEIFYSQWNPYRIVKYSLNGEWVKEFGRKTDFDTGLRLKIEKEEGKVIVSEEPSSFIPEIYCTKNDLIIVPVFSPDLKEKFIDIYDSEGNLLYACKLPIELYGKDTIILATEFDRNNNFYILYFTKEKPSLLSKFKIELPLR